MYEKFKTWFLFSVSFLIAFGLILILLFTTGLIGFIKVGLKAFEYMEEQIKNKIRDLGIFEEENKAI